jgi:hypothetical protein
MSYQAVIRNASNALVANQIIGMRITILTNGGLIEAYKETQTTTTNANGLASIKIGEGTVVAGNFSTVDWGNSQNNSSPLVFIKTETDPTGGTNYTIISQTQLLSVPYALFAKTSGDSWGLSGNSNTTNTSFIGTIGNNDLVFKRNNMKAGLISEANTTWGLSTLLNNTTGIYNTAIGIYALASNTTGLANTANGYAALGFNTTGFKNSALGYYSLYSNSTGSGNAALGWGSLYANTIGYNNSAFGTSALESNTTGYENTATGFESLVSNTTGYENTAYGSYALNSNISGNKNSANGFQSLYSNTTGENNTASGRNAMYNNTVGEDNTAIGSQALSGNVNGNNNSVLGGWAMINNISGTDNVGVGYFALSNNTTADKNTAVGREALQTITTGSNNTAIGYYAGNGLNGDRYNTTCLGYTTGWNTTNNNSVNIGNFSVGWIGGQVAWGNYSDKRIKNNIKENVPGLAFISQLKPVTYNLDIHKQYEIAMNGKKDDSADYPGKYDIEKVTQTGFLAQDVEAAAKNIGYDFSGVETPQDGQGLYKLRYSEFVVPMVKAIQEQQTQIEELKKDNEELKNLVNQLIKTKN